MSARYAYFEEIAEDEEFSFDDIAACDDIAQLQEWLQGIEATRADMHAQIEAYRLSGRDDDAWVYRITKALGFVGLGQSRIRQRMRELGHDTNPLGKKIDELNRKLVCMKAEAAFARNFVEVAREQFAEFEFRDLCDRAEARLSQGSRTLTLEAAE